MRIFPLCALVALLFVALATPLAAHDTTAGSLHIDHPWMPLPMATAKSAAGYMVITNNGDEADALVEVRTDFSDQSMLHTTEHMDGVAKMTHIMSVPIAPGATVTFEPDGLHVMFMGLRDKAVEGDLIPATLVFRHAGEVAVEFAVNAMAGHDHGDHSDHSGH